MLAKRRSLLALMLFGVSATALAHRFHIGLTEITFNSGSASVEVVHTYMSHDLDAMLAHVQKRHVDLALPADEVLLREYIESRFQLLGPGKKPLPLKWVGISLSTESVVIYQEIENMSLAAVEQVHSQVLVDFLPRQVNTVNIRQDGQLRSLTFDRKNPARRLR